MVYFCVIVGYYLHSMVEIVVSPIKKRTTPKSILGLNNIQWRMLNRCFEGYILSKYGSYDVIVILQKWGAIY
jgi:hypothetical protein